MEKAEIIEKTEKFVKTKLYGEGSGHDWWHTWRVWQMAKRIGKKEKADLFIIELASLLHDIADNERERLSNQFCLLRKVTEEVTLAPIDANLPKFYSCLKLDKNRRR